MLRRIELFALIAVFSVLLSTTTQTSGRAENGPDKGSRLDSAELSTASGRVVGCIGNREATQMSWDQLTMTTSQGSLDFLDLRGVEKSCDCDNCTNHCLADNPNLPNCTQPLENCGKTYAAALALVKDPAWAAVIAAYDCLPAVGCLSLGFEKIINCISTCDTDPCSTTECTTDGQYCLSGTCGQCRGNQDCNDGKVCNRNHSCILLAAPALISPLDQLILDTNEVTFSWDPAQGALTYQLIVADNANFQNPSFNQEVADTTYTTPIASLMKGTNYWKVASKNDGQIKWSVTRSFMLSPIRLTKSADHEIATQGEQVRITTLVTNQSLEILRNVTISDSACSIGNLGDLSPGQTRSYNCSLTMVKDLANFATANATLAGKMVSGYGGIFIYVPDGVVGDGETPSTCNEGALDVELYHNPDTIMRFACGGAATINIRSTKIISRDITLDGAIENNQRMTISGGKVVRIFEVTADATLTLKNLILADGHTDATDEPVGGGGIRNYGAVIVENSVFTGNSARYGGAIRNQGSLTVTWTSFTGNSATGGDGGGIFTSGSSHIMGSTFSENTAGGGAALINWGVSSTVEIVNSTLSNNHSFNGGGIENGGGGVVTVRESALVDNTAMNKGGGLINFGGTVTVIHTLLSGNEALLSNNPRDPSAGGGIYNFRAGTVEVTESEFSDNQARYGGGIHNNGTLTILNTTLRNNSAILDGGGIYNDGKLKIDASEVFSNTAIGGGGILNWKEVTTNGTAEISASTVRENRAVNGGGIQNGAGAVITVTNSTLSFNTAVFKGGGICNFDTGLVSLNHITLGLNSTDTVETDGGGIHNAGVIPVEISRSVLAQGKGQNCLGPVTSHGYNIDSGSSCGFQVPGDLVNVDPLLARLQDNGGPTWTHALLPSSPAHDWIPVLQCTIDKDQRFVKRPQGPACDSGAYEAYYSQAFLPLLWKHFP